MHQFLQQPERRTDNAASDVLLGSCHFERSGEATGDPTTYLGSDALGPYKPEKSGVTEFSQKDDMSGLGFGGRTNYSPMFKKCNNSEAAQKLPRSNASQHQPQLHSSQCSGMLAYTQDRNCQEQQKERKLQGHLHRHLLGGVLVSPDTQFEVQISEAQEREEKGGKKRRDDLNNLSVMPRAVNLRSPQKSAPLNSASIQCSPLTDRGAMTLRSFEATSETATTEGLQSLELQAPGEQASARLPQEALLIKLAVKGNQKRSLTATAAHKHAGPLREHKEGGFHQQSALHQPLRQQSPQEENQRKEQPRQQPRKQGPSRVMANFLFGTGQSQEHGHTSSLIHSQEISQETSTERRRLQQLEGKNGLRFGYDRRVRFEQISTGPSTATESALEHFKAHTGIFVAEHPASATASSFPGKHNDKFGPHIPVSLAANYPDPTSEAAHLREASPPAEAHFLPSAAATPPVRSLSSESGYTLPSRASPHPVKSSVSSGITTDQADAFYFAATAIGCSGLLCVAGFILLFAIFRSYRLRQQKHEAAKQLIRRIHCSGELHTRELVVQCSREMRSHKQKHKKKWHQGPIHPCWKSSSSTYIAASPPTASKLVPHPAQEHGSEALREAGTMQTEREGEHVDFSQSKAFDSRHHCRKWYSSDTTAGVNEVIRSGQPSETLTTEAAGAVQLSDHGNAGLPSKKQPIREKQEPYVTCNVAGARKGNYSSNRLHGQNATSPAAHRQVERAGVCCVARKRSLNQVDTRGCRQVTSSLSSDDALAVLPTPKLTRPESLWEITPLPLQAHVYKEEVRPQQPRPSQLAKDDEPQCTSKQKHSQLSRKVTSSVNELARTSPDQLSRAGPNASPSVVLLAFSPSLPFPRPFRATTKEQQKAQANGSQLVSPLPFSTGKAEREASTFNSKEATSSRVPLHILVSPHNDADGKSRVPGVSSAACRLAHFLHLRSRSRGDSSNIGDSCRDGGSKCSPTTSVSHSEESNRHIFFGSGRLRTGKASDYDSRHKPAKATSARYSKEEQLSSCLDEERPISTPPDAGDTITWVSEVSDNIPCQLGLKSSHSGQCYAHSALAVAQKPGGDGGPLSPCNAASEWGEGTNTDIPTHMMTTAINEEEGGSSEAAGSPDGDVTENDDDVVVEFDSSNISVATEEAGHNQVTISENIR